jgi:hypothetical protein
VLLRTNAAVAALEIQARQTVSAGSIPNSAVGIWDLAATAAMLLCHDYMLIEDSFISDKSAVHIVCVEERRLHMRREDYS